MHDARSEGVVEKKEEKREKQPGLKVSEKRRRSSGNLSKPSEESTSEPGNGASLSLFRASISRVASRETPREKLHPERVPPSRWTARLGRASLSAIFRRRVAAMNSTNRCTRDTRVPEEEDPRNRGIARVRAAHRNSLGRISRYRDKENDEQRASAASRDCIS